jgi:hypothetical protein
MELTLFLKTANSETRKWIAKDPSTPVDILVQLSQDEDWRVRNRVAENRNAPAEALSILSHYLIEDKGDDTREWVAGNTNTPVDVLVLLSQDEDWRVRRYVSSNCNTPIDTLVRLSRDESRWVRERVAENPRTPVETLVRLSQDGSLSVREEVARTPKWTEPANQERIEELKPLVELEKEVGVELF